MSSAAALRPLAAVFIGFVANCCCVLIAIDRPALANLPSTVGFLGSVALPVLLACLVYLPTPRTEAVICGIAGSVAFWLSLPLAILLFVDSS